MTYKEAKEYLQIVADSTPLAGYGAALNKAIDALEEVDKLRAELAEERYRFEKGFDYAVQRDKMIEQLKEDLHIKGLNDLMAYRMAEQEDRLVVLPCKLGDTVWTNISVQGDRYRKPDRPYPVEVVYIGMGLGNSYFHVEYSNGRTFPFDFDKIGKAVFLTREEAEAALKGEGNDDNS